MSDISLTASMRSNLLALQNTQSLMDTTQNRLSTGLKVNSAIDNPSSYYTAQSLNNRAGDLSALMDSMGQGINTLKAADEGIKSITKFVEQAKALANTAFDSPTKEAVSADTFVQETTDATAVTSTLTINGTTINSTVTTSAAAPAVVADGATIAASLNTAIQADADLQDKFQVNYDAETNKFSVVSLKGDVAQVSGTIGTSAGAVGAAATIGTADKPLEVGNAERASGVKRFTEIINQVNLLAKDSSYKGVNLLQGNDLKVIFNEDRKSFLDVKGTMADAESLGLEIPTTGWQTNDDIMASVTQAEGAINSLREMATEFGNNFSAVQNREEFTKNLINVLTEGADKLTLADMNEESANMLALQTRQQLAINSLSLASQAAQSVLKLF